jgi:hypothetical protein
MIWMNSAFRTRTAHSLLNSCWFSIMMMWFGTTQRRKIWGRRGRFLDTQFWRSKESCRYLVVENHIFWFWINQKFCFVVLISFPQNMEVFCNSNGFFSIKLISINFHSDFHVHIIVWSFWSIKNVMYWIVILSWDFSTLYFKVQILIIWNNHEYDVLMNCKVKCG